MKWFFNMIFGVVRSTIRYMLTLVLISVLLIVAIGVLIATGVITSDEDTPPHYPTKPAQNIYVTDEAYMISEDDKKTILEMGAALDAKHKAQVAVVTINSLNGESLEEYTNKLFRDWGIGDKKLNNGVLLLIAKKDRKFRIETGYGLEGALTDAWCGAQLDLMKPYFQAEDYSPAILQAYFRIVEKIYAEYGDEIPYELADMPPPDEERGRVQKEIAAQHAPKREASEREIWICVIIALIIAFVVIKVMGGGGGFHIGGFGGGFGGGSSGGGFGGGSSGGGGASGRW